MTHSEATRAAISRGVRARWQAKRERASLAVYAIDEALEALEIADSKIAKIRPGSIVLEGSYEEQTYREAQQATETAIHAMTVAAGVIRNATTQEK